MRASEIRTLFDYTYWATARVLSAAERVSPSAFTAPAGLSHDDLRSTPVHALSAERAWRVRCQEGVSPTAPLAPEDFPTLADIRARWREEESAMRSYLAGLSDADLDRKVEYRTMTGVPQTTPLWQILVHVVNHGTQTRSEAAVCVSQNGASPGDLDLSLYLRQR